VDLTGRAALLTGATRIGAVVALALAARGVDIAVSFHRSRKRAHETVDAVGGLGRCAIAVEADLTRPDACRDLVARTADALGRLDILLAMASIYQRVPYDQLTAVQWDEQLAVDLSSSFYCAKAAVPHMRAAGGGRIVLFSDWIAESGRPRYRGYVPYYVAKAGVIALAEALALEVAGDGILVNAIAPGPILPAASVGAAQNAAVVRVISLLESDFITGEVVRIDGGRHLR
jgi:3-oxoacyl-[acyl-carrier protein] reductase